MTRVGLVACCARKLAHPAPARELYCSPLFERSRRYVEASCDEWFVLSARHALVEPGQVLAPYDYSMADRRAGRGPGAASGPERVRQWDTLVNRELARRFHPLLRAGAAVELVVLAGRDYRGFVRGWCDDTDLRRMGFRVAVPFEGLGIGRLLAALDRALSQMPSAPPPPPGDQHLLPFARRRAPGRLTPNRTAAR